MRNTKTEYVSCPSCGRTLFSLQEVTDQIRVRTGHLPGVAIAIMGCIVNGPGEMADAGKLRTHMCTCKISCSNCNGSLAIPADQMTRFESPSHDCACARMRTLSVSSPNVCLYTCIRRFKWRGAMCTIR